MSMGDSPLKPVQSIWSQSPWGIGPLERVFFMKVTIDRFEENYAVCEKEDKTMINIEKSRVPKEAAEGDILNISESCITIDVEETQKRKAEIEELSKNLWK